MTQSVDKEYAFPGPCLRCSWRENPPPYPYFQLSAAEDTAGGLALVIGSLGSVGPWNSK